MTDRRKILRAVRIVFAIALTAGLAYAVDWRSMPRYIATIDWPLALLAMAGLASHFIISPWKWQWALRIHHLYFDLPYLTRSNGIGFFFNNFLPSAIGGDAYRIMSTWPTEGYRSRAVSAVVIERVVGLIALMAIGNLAALTILETSRIAPVFVAVSMLCALAGICLLVVLSMGVFRWLTSRFRKAAMVDAVAHNINLLRTAGARWLPLLAISLLFQVIAVANIYLLFWSVGAPLGIAACALIAAVSGLATILPISINGLGVVEGSFAGAAVALGGDYELALMVAVLIRLMVLPGSLFFGILYGLSGMLARRRQHESPAAQSCDRDASAHGQSETKAPRCPA